MGELSGTETAAAVIGPDSTTEDTGATTVDVDAAVGILDVDNTGVEAGKREKTKSGRHFITWTKHFPMNIANITIRKYYIKILVHW